MFQTEIPSKRSQLSFSPKAFPRKPLVVEAIDSPFKKRKQEFAKHTHGYESLPQKFQFHQNIEVQPIYVKDSHLPG